MRRLTIVTCTILLGLVGCGGTSPAPAEPAVDNQPADDAAEPAVVSEPINRPPEACVPVLDHLQSVVVEAIDREGMMEACQHEWSGALVACLDTAHDDDGVAACW